MEEDAAQAKKAPTFDEMINLDDWEPVEEFFASAGDLIADDVREAVSLRRKLREELLSEAPEIKEKIRRPDEKMLAWARNELFSGQVCAIDGTISRSPSLSGGRARIGVAATSYVGNRIQRVLYVSYRQMADPVTSAIDYFERLKKINRTSELLMRAVMAFSERALALRRAEKWRFVHGELLPYELWAALGKGRPLKARLELAATLIETKTIIAVVEGSHNVELLNAGELLSPGEYLDARTLKAELLEYKSGNRDDGRGAHFSKQEGEEFETFIERYGQEVRVGLFKAGMRSYLFHAHKEVFDQAAALVLVDASHQAIRGFPLLIDYADHICGHNLAQRDFERQVEFKTARLGMDVLGAEIDPRKTRRR
jgi:hypothetical protein